MGTSWSRPSRRIELVALFALVRVSAKISKPSMTASKAYLAMYLIVASKGRALRKYQRLGLKFDNL